jgi:hypothetical protein
MRKRETNCFRYKSRFDNQWLDEAEFALIYDLYAAAVRTIKEQGRVCKPDCWEELIMQQYRPVLDAYRRITGSDHEGHPSLLMHHRVSTHGPICRGCGKPLRTPKASYCAACGTKRS